MKTVIFTNDQRQLRTQLKTRGEHVSHYVVFAYTRRTARVLAFVRKHTTQFRYLKLQRAGHDIAFLKAFVALMGQLNQYNHALFWWGLNLTNKNPISSPLCNRVYAVVSIFRVLAQADVNTLVVITDDAQMLKQSQLHHNDTQVHLVDALRRQFSLKRAIECFTPLAVLFACIRTGVLSVYAKCRCRLRLDRTREHIVVLSLLNHQSFKKDGTYHDAYFGDFVNYLYKQQIPFINLLLIITPQYRQILKKAYAQPLKIPILPVEYFLSLCGLWLCLAQAVRYYLWPTRVQGQTVIDDIDVRYLIEQAIKEECRSTRFFDTVRIYFAVRDLGTRLSIKKFYFPFENRAFEKMALLGLSAASPQTYSIGYQHASLSLRHTNFFLTDEEAAITPLPDRILTMGEITKDLMIREGHFPAELLTASCALRQGVSTAAVKPYNPTVRNLFIPLATGIDEYVKVLLFLEAALHHNDQFTVWIRPHPVFALADALAITGPLSFQFHRAVSESLATCLEWADVILYVHSTVALEGMSRGIPLVNIAIDNPINADPLFDFRDFKWNVSEPSHLLPIIRAIESMSNAEFSERQRKAQEYIQSYFGQVTESTLHDFLHVH